MLEIRAARDNELLRVARLWSEFMAYNGKFNDSFRIRKQGKEIFSREMLEKTSDKNNHLAVADYDGEIVGFCFSYISQKPRFFQLDKFGFIGDLFVLPEYRRMGIGRELVDDAMNFFAGQKIKQIELLVAKKNVETIKFWESLGFSHLLTWMYKRK